MSEQVLCLVVTLSVITLMFAWVPFIYFVCPQCSRALERHWLRKVAEGRRRVSLANQLHVYRSWPVKPCGTRDGISRAGEFGATGPFANGCVFYDVTQGDIVGACGTSPGQNKNTPRHTLNNLWLPSIAWDTKDESPSLY
jgi:hypothetical protein